MPEFNISPITAGELTIDTMTLPNPEDAEAWMVLESIERAGVSGNSTILEVLAACSGQPYKLVRKIKMQDLNSMKPALDAIMGNAK